ncbi:MAG: HD domain-containing phosphohydrolase [Spirochaetota bacterium]
MAAQHIAAEGNDVVTCIEDDILDCISASVPGTDAETPLCTILFIHEDEYTRIKDTISIFDQRNFIYGFCLYIENTVSDNPLIPEEDIHYIWTDPLKEIEFRFAVVNTVAALQQQYLLKANTNEYLARLLEMKQDQYNLINIGKSLAIEKDSDKLLRLILKKSKMITGADAGSIYIIEQPDPESDRKQIRFKYSHTFSKEIPLEEFVIPFDTTSIAGYVAVTGRILNIPDVYNLTKNDPVEFNKSFDKKNNYVSRSMLVIPMKSHTGALIGVIQLINSKKPPSARSSTGNEAFEIILNTEEDFTTRVFPFDKRYEDLMESIAGQAAIALENSRLFNQIQNQFEEFVKASVTAIESRDPATSGHSFRVAEICKQMAHAINNCHRTPWAETTFSATQIKELEYAALLHDFGKVYIDLQIFQKAKKLYPKDFDNLILKLNLLYRSVELQHRIKQNELLIDPESSRKRAEVELIDKQMRQILDRIHTIKESIIELNEPTPTDADPREIVSSITSEISSLDCCTITGDTIDILTDEEIENLCIKRGSLNPRERKEIENHVVHTYNFVKRIPWPTEFQNIPRIALMHHEKSDGTGYPSGLKGEEIPLQARIMAIADMYDALSASDRPYKRALSHERTLEILQAEADAGKIDRELFEIFLDSKITMEALAVS